MPGAKTTATVRMYNVGFGDSFLITVASGRTVWRMLVDCGVFPAGQTRPIHDSVEMIINDLRAVAPVGSAPHLDVIVATHHHIDHISGFADPEWEKVHVDEVWVPYVEDPEDTDGAFLRNAQTTAARTLRGLISAASNRLAATDETAREKLAIAGIFAANSEGDDPATDRLLGRNGARFLNEPRPRYLPDADATKNVIPTTINGVAAHILGPSRNPAEVKRMNPPKSVRWLQLVEEERPADADVIPLFDPAFAVADANVLTDISDDARATVDKLELHSIGAAEELLAAASILENSVNNTSVYFVLDIRGTRLLFVGDSQHGAWEHVLNDPASLELVTAPKLYKIGHHGSHNATPKRFAEELLGREGYVMMPFRSVSQWPSIPERKLITALESLDAHLIRADKPPKEGDGIHVDPENRWSEVTFDIT
jgi:beta-lactamase superfamily II metal-dependent hydrolase